MRVDSGILSVPSSLVYTRNITMLSSDRENMQNSVKCLYGNTSASVKSLPDACLVILFYSAVNCMRIAELLNIRVCDVLPGERYIVRGLKHGRSYTVHMPLLHYARGGVVPVNEQSPLLSLTYKTLWQWCERVGLGFRPENNVNCARTHAHRYLTARAISTKLGLSDASDALHHNSRRSVDYYI